MQRPSDREYLKIGGRRDAGFTLIEVLVAVAVLAIAMSAVIKVVSESGSNLSQLREKTLAHWVAENKLAELQVSAAWPEGRQKGTSEMGGRPWYWEVETENTQDANLRHVTIKVSDQENGGSARAVLHGFLGNPELRVGIPGRQGFDNQPPPPQDQGDPLGSDGGAPPNGGDGSLPPGGEAPPEASDPPSGPPPEGGDPGGSG